MDFQALQEIVRYDKANSEMLLDLTMRTPRIQPMEGDGGWLPSLCRQNAMRYDMFSVGMKATKALLALPRVRRWLQEWRDSASQKEVSVVAEEMMSFIAHIRACKYDSSWVWARQYLYTFEVNAMVFILCRMLCEGKPNRVWRMAIRRCVLNGALHMDGKYAYSIAFTCEADLPEGFLNDMKIAKVLAFSASQEMASIVAAKKLERIMPAVAAWTGARMAPIESADHTDDEVNEYFLSTLIYLSGFEEEEAHSALTTLGWW
jgi:hypothetical protein